MDGDGACLAGEVCSLIVGHALVVVMEADVLGSEELKAAYLVTVFLGQTDEVGAVLLLRIGVVNDHAAALLHLLLSHLVALLLRLQCIPVHTTVLGHVCLPEGGFARRRTPHEDHHLLFHELHLVPFTHDHLSGLGNSGRVEPLHFDRILLPKEQVLGCFELDAHIEGEFEI